MGVFANNTRLDSGSAMSSTRIKFKETRIMEMLVVCRRSRCSPHAAFQAQPSVDGLAGFLFSSGESPTDRPIDRNNDGISIVKNPIPAISSCLKKRETSPRVSRNAYETIDADARRDEDQSRSHGVLSSFYTLDDSRDRGTSRVLVRLVIHRVRTGDSLAGKRSRDPYRARADRRPRARADPSDL